MKETIAKQPRCTYIDWDYPEIYDEKKRDFIQISLTHTRAADDLRIEFSSKRDGWVILQEIIHTTEGHYVGQGVWKEVAFIDTWQNAVEVPRPPGGTYRDEHLFPDGKSNIL